MVGILQIKTLKPLKLVLYERGILMFDVQVTMDPDTQEPQDELTSTAVAWFQSIGISVTTVSEVLSSQDERITQCIQDGITRANERAVSHAQNVQKWFILRRDFSIVHGELGTCLPLLVAL